MDEMNNNPASRQMTITCLISIFDDLFRGFEGIYSYESGFSDFNLDHEEFDINTTDVRVMMQIQDDITTYTDKIFDILQKEKNETKDSFFENKAYKDCYERLLKLQLWVEQIFLKWELCG